MTPASLLARLRTIVDEAAQSYFTDTECYAALSDGQRALINIVLSIYNAKAKINPHEKIPEVLFPLIKTVNNTLANGAASIGLPSDYLQDLWLTYNHDSPLSANLKPCRKRNYGLGYPQQKSNSYMKDNPGNEYFYSIYGTIINLETPVTVNTGNYQFAYIPIAADIISGGGNPVLQDNALMAVVHYAAADLFTKDELNEAANLEFQKFLQLTRDLY